MAAHAAAGVIHQEGFDEYLQGVLLPLGTGIGRVTAGVESAFVADTDATGVVTLGMCTREILPAGNSRCGRLCARRSGSRCR